MAFRLSAEKSDLQPQQEITVYWDGRVVYLEEPALLSEDHFLDGESWNHAGDIRGDFYIEEKQVAECLENLVNDAVDELGSCCVKESEHYYKCGECWIEMTTGRGKQEIGWYEAPNIETVMPSDAIPPFSGKGGGTLPASTENIWEELTEQAYNILD